jgi:hypothetical protein
MFINVDRHEIIAALDAEIARLQHVRLLIKQSVVRVRRGDRPTEPLVPTKSRRGRLFTAARKLITRAQRERQIQSQQEVPVLVTRVPAKEAPKQRLIRAASKKERTALTGDVPQGPVAAPGKKGRQMAEGLKADLPQVTSPPPSAFGQAITRGLATLGG